MDWLGKLVPLEGNREEEKILATRIKSKETI